MKTRIRRIALTLALGFGIAGSAAAAQATLHGTHTTFTFDDALVGLFGMPTVVGDSLYFAPDSFAATASGPLDAELLHAALNINVTTISGYVLTGVKLEEGGSYLLSGSGTLGVKDYAAISAHNLASSDPLVKDVTAFKEVLKNQTDADVAAEWGGEANLSFLAWQSSSVKVTIANLLLAYVRQSDDASWAYISKSATDLNFGVAQVPEAETYAMLLAGLGLIGAVVRRRIK